MRRRAGSRRYDGAMIMRARTVVPALLLGLALAWAPAIGEPTPSEAAPDEPVSSGSDSGEAAPDDAVESPALPAPFRGVWRIDRDATLDLYKKERRERRQQIAAAIDYIARFDVVLGERTYDSIPSVLGEPIPLTVLESDDARARIAIETPDMGRVDYAIELLGPDLIKLINGADDAQIDVVCARVTGREIIEGDPVAFLTGSWRIDMARLEDVTKDLAPEPRRRIVEGLRDFAIEVTPESFSEVQGYTLEKLAPNRYDVDARGETYFHVTIHGPDEITLISGRSYPLERVENPERRVGED